MFVESFRNVVVTVSAAIQLNELDDRFVPADSTGRRNTLLEPLGWGLVLQGLSGAFVELSRNRAELCLAVGRHIDPSRKVLAQEAVCVFIAAALPR